MRRLTVVRVGGYLDTYIGDDGRGTRWQTFDVGREKARVNVSPKLGTHYCVTHESEECDHAEAVRTHRGVSR